MSAETDQHCIFQFAVVGHSKFHTTTPDGDSSSSSSSSSSSTQTDPETLKLLVNLLGKDLVAAKKRLMDLEKRLEKEHKVFESSPVKKLNDRVDAEARVAQGLQREVDRYKDEQATLKAKIARLQDENEKSKIKENEVKALREQITSLKAQQRSERDRTHHLKKKIKALNETLLTLQDSKRTPTDPFATMASLPLSPQRPKQGDLSPIATKGTDIKSYLSSHPGTHKYANTSLLKPGQLLWCTSSRGYHHALMYAPTHVFDTSERIWRKDSTLSPLYGQTRELFYLDKRQIFYAGTYKCIHLEHSIVEWPKPRGDDLAPRVIADVALSEDFPNAPHASTHRGTLTKFYRDGVLRLECMGLQCVGFNTALYELLVRLHEHGTTGSSKRKASSLAEVRTPESKKKQKKEI